MCAIPVELSWKRTLVPLRKFLPMIKTSSPPATEPLWRLFLRISGTPAGWAENATRNESQIWKIISLNIKSIPWYPLHLLHKIGDERAWRIRTDPSGLGMLTLKAKRARVLFFLEPATPIRASTSAFLSFKIPTQSTLPRHITIHFNNTYRLKETVIATGNWGRNDPYARVKELVSSRFTSITVVPSISTSLQAVVLRPVTLQAW